MRSTVVAVCVPVVAALGMTMVTGRYWFLAIVVLSPILYVLTRRTRAGSGPG